MRRNGWSCKFRHSVRAVQRDELEDILPAVDLFYKLYAGAFVAAPEIGGGANLSRSEPRWRSVCGSDAIPSMRHEMK